MENLLTISKGEEITIWGDFFMSLTNNAKRKGEIWSLCGTSKVVRRIFDLQPKTYTNCNLKFRSSSIIYYFRIRKPNLNSNVYFYLHNHGSKKKLYTPLWTRETRFSCLRTREIILLHSYYQLLMKHNWYNYRTHFILVLFYTRTKYCIPPQSMITRFSFTPSQHWNSHGIPFSRDYKELSFCSPISRFCCHLNNIIILMNS